jgi:hypothetical protein
MNSTGIQEPRASGPSAAQIALGLALVVPAVFIGFVAQALPALKTIAMSLTKTSFLGGASFIGMRNFSELAGPGGIAPAFGYSFVQGLLRSLCCVVPCLLIGWGAAGLPKLLRKILRCGSMLPLGMAAPALAGMAWATLANPVFGVLGRVISGADPAQAIPIARIMDLLSWFGLSLGLCTSLAMSAAAGRDEGSGKDRLLPRFVLLGLVLSLAACALAPQAIEDHLAFPLTGFDPQGITPAMAAYRQGFMMMKMGSAAATSTLVLLQAGLFGILACLVLVLGRFRLSLGRAEKAASAGRARPATIAAFAACALGLVLVILPVALLGGSAGQSMSIPRFLGALNAGPALFYTVFPALTTVLFIQLPFAFLAALGIGALRPLGKHSELILFLFAPFLFVAFAPLSFQHFLDARSLRALDGMLFRIIPHMSCVPMIFVLTLFFKGQRPLYDSCADKGFSSFARSFILPSLPLAGLLGLLSFGYLCGENLTAMVILQNQRTFTFGLNLMRLSGSYAAGNQATGIAFLSWMGAALAFLAFLPFQAFYLDKLELGSGKDAVAAE